MKSNKWIIVISLALILSACGAGVTSPTASPIPPTATPIPPTATKDPNVTIDQLPVFSGATETTSEAFDKIRRALRAGFGVKEEDFKYYNLSARATWSDVATFYRTELKKSKWEEFPSPDSETFLSWNRKKQSVFLMRNENGFVVALGKNK